MRKFKEIVKVIFDWTLILIFSVILIGGSLYVIKDLLF